MHAASLHMHIHLNANDDDDSRSSTFKKSSCQLMVKECTLKYW